MIFIYGLKCPLLGVIRYIGKSIKPEKRFIGHITGANTRAYNHHTARWIRKLLAAGLRPELVIVRTLKTDERWQDVEREYIASAEQRGWKLTNSTAGGEGLDYRDPKDEERYRANLSAALKKVWGTPERRKEASERSLKAWANPDVTQKRLASLLEAAQRPETKAKLREAMQEVHSRLDVLAKRSNSVKQSWTDPKVRLSHSNGMNREKMSLSAKARWSDPTQYEASRAYLKTPERRAALSASATRRATPEYRAMMAEKTRLSWDKRRASAKDKSP